MATFLFGDIIFGPVKSRRLGVSLGVNLLPVDGKICSFNCIYCECGWNRIAPNAGFNKRADVVRLLEEKLKSMSSDNNLPDVITFSGNGEPTLHPDFDAIVDDVIALRNRYAPNAKVSVLSNATIIGRESVRKALLKVDNNILKLDSAFDRTVNLIDKPAGKYSVAETVANMKLFEGKLTVQTMFLRGVCEGEFIDNTIEEEVAAWVKLIEDIRPAQVMIYSLDRDTPASGLEKVAVEELESIAQRVRALGITCSVAG